jgi:hypothetical protein
MNNETLKNKQLCSDLTGVVSAAVDIAYVSTGPECSLGPAPTKLTAGQFQDLRDTKHLITSKPGMFWCYTHLADLPLEKQAPDPRYCQECFEVLSQEAKDTGVRHSKKAPWWLPAVSGACKKNSDVVLEGGGNMSTLKAQNSTVDKLSRPVVIRPGPKSKVLPMDLIKQLVSEGQGSKMIAKRLTSDGIDVSYKTIQRLLKKVKA